MGIVVMHLLCQILRVFLAGLAVYFMHDTLTCMKMGAWFAPPLWSMCAESISSLLIMINSSGNFLIYCSMLPPFKEALSKICAFLCFWKFWRPNSEFNHDSEIEAININERTPFTTTTSASNNTRHAVVVHHREMVP